MNKAIRVLSTLVLTLMCAHAQIPVSGGGGGGNGVVNYKTPAIVGTGTSLSILQSDHKNSHSALITECYNSSGVALIQAASPSATQFNYTVAQTSPFNVSVTFGT